MSPAHEKRDDSMLRNLLRVGRVILAEASEAERDGLDRDPILNVGLPRTLAPPAMHHEQALQLMDDDLPRELAVREDEEVRVATPATEWTGLSHPTTAESSSPTKAIEFDRFYGDGSFLKLLQETLQKNADVLKRGTVKLALSPVAVAYLSDRLHSTLCPKRATDKSGRIDGWTIRGSPNTQSFRRVLSPRKSDLFVDTDLVPIGHLDVLKLSTLLSETAYLKIKGNTQDVSSSTSIPVHFDLFPSLKTVELHHLTPDSVHLLICFVGQMETLHSLECDFPSPRLLLQHGTWPLLTSLTFVRCNVQAWPADEMHAVPQLKHFTMSHNRLRHLDALPAPSTLESVDVSHNRLQVLQLDELFPALTSLTLDHNALDSLHALPLASVPHLEHLDVSHNALVDLASVNVLGQLKRLKTLHLAGNPLARYPDYRRQVLFYLGEGVDLDDMPWTWTKMDSMRFPRHYKGSKGPLAYPFIPRKPLHLQARRVTIVDSTGSYLPAALNKSRAQSSFSDMSSIISSRGPSIASDMDELLTKPRSTSYHVDEFLRDLADEESPEDAPPLELEQMMPPTTPGVPVTIYLSLDQAESLDLPLSREGIGGLVHVTSTKLMEYLPGGAIIQRYRAHLLCMAVYSNASHHMSVQLGFRNRPTVAYKVADTAILVPLVRAMYETLVERPITAFKCKACGALVVSREKQRHAQGPLILAARRCWMCNSSNGRDYAVEKIPTCLTDIGLPVAEEHPVETRPFETTKQGFVIEADYDDGVVGRDEIIWVVTETAMKEMKLTHMAGDILDDNNNEQPINMDFYWRVCGRRRPKTPT
ncbi:Aste57867_22992 [Aphanomyces stellatus]|uniref:Aste57867_22992 protein n=1 Tax=Aphanomyces stellatus TaxID=120398 RepID=A0A485LNE5_9STRA|nr:hypothetical protein As57867_022921 [Aphanomyces stellatus]VFT99641.1 Aste57867_22992 [Aphanomyces stellatus]